MIRPAREDDTEAMVAVWRRAARLAQPFFTEDQFATEERDIRETYLPMAEQWVHEIDGRVVGFIAMLDSTIGGLFVDPDFHRRGIGSALVDFIHAKKRPLDVEVFAENPIGPAFYAKKGFLPTGERDCELTGHRLIILRLA